MANLFYAFCGRTDYNVVDFQNNEQANLVVRDIEDYFPDTEMDFSKGGSFSSYAGRLGNLRRATREYVASVVSLSATSLTAPKNDTLYKKPKIYSLFILFILITYSLSWFK